MAQLTDAQRARKNLKARIKYAENKKGITFQYSEVNYDKFDWETEEEYIERISQYKGEQLWEQGEEQTKYVDEWIIPTIEEFFANFENATYSDFPSKFQYRIAEYKKGIAEAAFNTALNDEGREDLAERLTELTNANEIQSLLEQAIYAYEDNGFEFASQNPALQEFLSLMEGRGLSLEEAQDLADYYGY